jgi:hypothetical protein
MKTGTYFKQRANTAINPCPAIGWSRDSRKDLQKRAFTRSITSDDAEDLTALLAEPGATETRRLVARWRDRTATSPCR